MDVNMLSLLMPALQSGKTSPGQGKAGEMPHTGFAGLLAMLQSQQHSGPEKALAALLVAQQSGEETAMILPFMQLLPQLQIPETVADEVVPEEDLAGMTAVPLFAPAPQPLVALPAEGSAEVVTAEPAASLQETVHEPLEQQMWQSEAVTTAQTEFVLAEAMTGSAAKGETLEAPHNESAAKSVEKPEPPIAAMQEKSMTDEALLPQTNGTQSGAVEITADKPAAQWQRLRSAQRGPAAEQAKPDTEAHHPLPFRAALQTPAATTAPSQLNRAAIAEQVLEKMVVTKEADGETTLFVRLRPAALGEVEISLRMEAGRLTASIITENVQVKEALEASLGQIRQRLETQQIQVSEITVTVGQEQNSRQEREPQSPWRSQRRGHGSRYRTAEVEESRKVATAVLTGLVDIRA